MGADPQRYPQPQGVACRPQWHLSTPPEGADAAVAGRSQRMGPERCTRLPSGGGHRGAVGKNHQGGNRAPYGICREGLYCNERRHVGRALGAGARSVLPTPGCIA